VLQAQRRAKVEVLFPVHFCNLIRHSTNFQSPQVCESIRLQRFLRAGAQEDLPELRSSTPWLPSFWERMFRHEARDHDRSDPVGAVCDPDAAIIGGRGYIAGSHETQGRRSLFSYLAIRLQTFGVFTDYLLVTRRKACHDIRPNRRGGIPRAKDVNGETGTPLDHQSHLTGF